PGTSHRYPHLRGGAKTPDVEGTFDISGVLLRSNRQDVRLIYARASDDQDTSAHQRGVSAYHRETNTGGGHDCIERPVDHMGRSANRGTTRFRTSRASSTDLPGKEGPRPIHRGVAVAACGPAEIDIPDLH